MPNPFYRPDLRTRARRLRREATLPERLLWSRLRRRALGVRFLRQQPIADYIVDFFCPEQSLVVEVDGRSHLGRAAYDARRQRRLEALGFRVVRVTNDEVLTDLDGVVERLAAVVREANSGAATG